MRTGSARDAFRSGRWVGRLGCACLRWCLAAACLWGDGLGSGAAGAQSAAADTVYHLHGTVVNGQTGQPIARALVVSLDRRLATMTDSTGRFAIEVEMTRPVSTGAQSGPMRFGSMLMLRAQKPGFDPQPQPLLLPLDESLSDKDVSLKLMPVSVVTGTVSAPSGDGARDVQVMLLRRQIVDGEPSWQPAGMHATNREGEFRFGNLPPGEYTMVTMESFTGGGFGRPSQSDSERYPPVYYGDAPNLNSATKLTLHYGETARTEIHLHRTRFYPVTVVVGGGAGAGVAVRVVGADRFSSFGFAFDGRDRVIEGTLPDGDYTLVISSSGQPQSFARVPITVAGAPVRVGPVGLAPASRIEVHVHPEFTAKGTDGQPGMVQVMLRSEENGFAMSEAAHDGELAIENVQPGRYTVMVNVPGGYAASVSSGETDLLQQPLIVGSGSVPAIEVVTRNDVAGLKGKVTFPEGAPPERTFVFLVPEGAGRMTQVVTDVDGSFRFGGVRPGAYRLLASGNPLLQIAYRDPDVMRAYDSKLPAVTLAAGETASADAPFVDLDAEGSR